MFWRILLGIFLLAMFLHCLGLIALVTWPLWLFAAPFILLGALTILSYLIAFFGYLFLGVLSLVL